VYMMLNVDTLSQCQINVVAGVAFAYCAPPFGLQRRAFYVISVQVHIIVHVSADKTAKNTSINAIKQKNCISYFYIGKNGTRLIRVNTYTNWIISTWFVFVLKSIVIQ